MKYDAPTALPPSPMMIEFAELAQSIATTRARFQAVIDAGAGLDADAIAQAMARELAILVPSSLPLAAEMIWRDRIARALKSDANKPLTPRAIGLLRSWPSGRLGDLVKALCEIEAILAEAENDARNEVIYAEISRAYS